MLGSELDLFLSLDLTLDLGPVDVLLVSDSRVDTGCKTPDTFHNDGLLDGADHRWLANLRIDGHLELIRRMADGIDGVGVHGDGAHTGLSW